MLSIGVIHFNKPVSRQLCIINNSYYILLPRVPVVQILLQSLLLRALVLLPLLALSLIGILPRATLTNKQSRYNHRELIMT